jgi:flagellar biosynthetic protein FliQ
MTEGLVIELAKEAMMTTLMLAGPLLAVCLIVGLLISIFQAATQINEMTLTFVPKAAATILLLALLGPWMMNTMLTYTARLFANLALFVR